MYPTRSKNPMDAPHTERKPVAWQGTMPDWKTETPTESGWYWIYIPNHYAILKHLEDKSLRACVEVNVLPVTNEIQFEIYAHGYEWDYDFYPSEVTYWLGPLPVPESPVEIPELINPDSVIE